MQRSFRLQVGRQRAFGLTAVTLALVVGVAAAIASGASGPPQGKQSGIADFGIASPQTSDWDKGGASALATAAQKLGAKPTWLSNISFDQAPQVIDRLVAQKIPVIFSNGSGYGNAMTQAAQKYPNTWFVVYSDLASTGGLPNLAAVRLHWNQMAYLAGMMACEASKTGKVGLVISQPIPAYAHAVGGMMDGVKKFCGSSRTSFTRGRGRSVTYRRRTGGAGADREGRRRHHGLPGLRHARRDRGREGESEHPLRGDHERLDRRDPEADRRQCFFINYESGYNSVATMLLQNKLKPQIYLTDAQTGGIGITKIYNTTPDVAKKINQAFGLVKSGKLQVAYSHQVKQ